MSSNDIEHMHLSGLTVEDVMNFEENDLDLLLKNIRNKILRNRMDIEQCLEEL